MNNNNIFKTFFILVIFTLIFLVCYNLIKKDDITFVKANSTLNEIYYCDDDSYVLNNKMCFRNNVYKSYLLGDLDNNDIVNINDIEIIKEYTDNKKELSNIQILTADVNNDNIVDINDIIIMQDNLKDNNTEIGKKYVCNENDVLNDNLCISKYSKEAKVKKIVKGDINQNKKVDNNDLYLVYSYINDKSYLTNLQKEIADINSDGKIDNKDFKWYKNRKLKNVIINNENYEKINNIYNNEDLEIVGFKEKKNINKDFYKYYFDLKISKDLYYKLEIFSDDKKVVESECKKISNNTRVEFNIEFLGINNYGKITVFSDECINKITEYKTDNYNNDKSIK